MEKFNFKKVVVAAVGAIAVGLGFLIKKNWGVIKDKFKRDSE